MEKICPNCARRCVDIAEFCPACGTVLQNVPPVNTQPQVAYSPVAPVQPVSNQINLSVGAKILYFVPLVLCIIDILAIWVFEWVSVNTLFDDVFIDSVTLSDVYNYMMFDEEVALVVSIFVFPMMVDWLLILIGSILLACRKTGGKVLTIVGNSLLLPLIIAFIIVFMAGSVEAEGMISLGFGPIFLLISSIAGIVFASVVKTGKALMKSSYPAAYVPVYTPVVGQPVYPQQQYYN